LQPPRVIGVWGASLCPAPPPLNDLADAETKVVYAQPRDQLPHARELLGLTDTEAELLPHLRRGWALWKVGERSFLVEHQRSKVENGLVDTDARMTTRRAA